MANLVIPDYQVALLREKEELGRVLSTEEQEIISNHPATHLNTYLSYIKKLHPTRFAKIVDENQLTPINNYRESYRLAQLLIKSWNKGLTSGLPQSEELSKVSSTYRTYSIIHKTCNLTSLVSLGLFNVAFAVPRYRGLPSFIVQNLALWVVLRQTSCLIESKFWNLSLPHMYSASWKYQNDLSRLQDEGKILYQYEDVIEDFPPDAFAYHNLSFLESSNLYDSAHKDDFEPTGRRHSQFTFFKEGKNKLA